MRKLIIALSAAAVLAPAMPAAAQTPYQQDRRDAAREYRHDLRNADDRGDVREARRDYRENIRDARQDRRDRREAWRDYNRYDYNRGDPRYGNAYYADRYYRDGRYYQERRLSRNDRVYRGQNGRYYCRRPDGTTGLIIGAVGGGLLGNAIDNGRSSTLGTLLGAGAGALLGREIDRGNVRCR